MTPGYPDTTAHLADELRRLDVVIRRHLAVTARLDELSPHSQTTRTVYISREEV